MAFADSLVDRVAGRSRTIGAVVAALAVLLVAAPPLYHLARGSLAYLGLLEDDYFYYAVIADKLASLGKLTYDTQTATNGFHPLWFVVILIFRVITGGLGAPFYVLLSLAFATSMAATYALSVRFARAVGATDALAPPVALLHVVATFLLIADGMETAVDVPLLLLFLVEVARDAPLVPRRAAKLGFLASLAILARLDVAILVALLGVLWIACARPKLAEAARVAAWFGAAGIAVPLYAAANLVAFGSILPLSAVAKQLVVTRGVSLSYLKVVALHTPYGPAAGLTMILGAIAFVVVWRRGLLPPRALFLSALTLAFPAVFYALNSLNGWMFFGWYAYPLVPALMVGTVLVGRVVATWMGERARARATGLLIAGVAALVSLQALASFVHRGPMWRVEDNGLLAMSRELADRMHAARNSARTHDGDRDTPVYAMGAISGFAGYFLQAPIVQLEGLVADRRMIEHIRHQDDLLGVLREYGVDYLVVSVHQTPLEKADGCYVVTQPDVEWAGRRVAKMRGAICSEPIVHFQTSVAPRPWSIIPTLDTYVFDVRARR